IEIHGALLINDDGISLRMMSADSWTMIKKNEDVEPRLVDLLAQSHEDAWSLVEVTGTVREVNRSLIQLDTQETQITVSVRPIIHYRAERLHAGDVIQVRGLIDTREETPKIFPRQSKEIVLLNSARKPSSDIPEKNGLPPWTPIGSAGLTVALAQGVKYVRKIREGQRLAKLLAEATQNLS
ncbi:MAG: hypothetical protein Q8R07_02995, partial [Candidatus Uhrbacteria bacterium]|nr:hypothetical protein [Candidatus Uhrbacteria bacterium]